MNFFKRLFYRAERDLRQAFKDHAEKIYYKAYPERINDHELSEIARQPLPIIREERYRPITICSLEHFPEEYIDKISEDEIKGILARNMVSNLKEFIEIKRDDTYYCLQTRTIRYRGEIKILKEA
jgi:hypothetical protein